MATVILPTEPCGPDRPLTAVDLVVLIDTSGSMLDEAKEVSDAAAAAVQAAATSCPSDLRVGWLGIEGTWENTQFTESYRTYLHRLGVADADLTAKPGHPEEGGPAMVDLSRHFDWRPGAGRAIFYLSDEGLKLGTPQNKDDVEAANAAIDAARAAQVKIFTYAGTGILPIIASEFARVAQETGGQSFVAPASNLGGFQRVLRDIICATVIPCVEVEPPSFGPCFEIQRETVDPFYPEGIETLTITAYNPYANLLFSGVTVFVSLVTAAGQPPDLLPNGEPAAFIKPSNPICLGDLRPCRLDQPRDLTRFTYEVVMVSQGAPPGTYLVKLDYSFSLELTGASQFEVQIATPGQRYN